MKRRRIFCMILVLAMMLSMVACSGGGNKPVDQETPSETPSENSGSAEQPTENPKRDTLIYAWGNDATTMDPHVQNDHSELPVAMVYSTLLQFNPYTNEIVCDLAESWEVSEDKCTWTFKIKEGVKFHNGKELTAGDVKATYDRFIDPDADAAYLVVVEICKMFKKVDVIDKYTVSITTDEPYGPMMALLCNRSLAIMDKDILEKYGDQTGLLIESTVGTGPYKLTEWRKGEEMVMERYEDYFGEPAKIKNLIWRTIPDSSARIVALQNGEVDLVMKLTSEDIMTLEQDPNIEILKAKSVGQRQFRFAFNDPIMKNKKVRQAIVHAVDREAILNGLFKGLGEVSTCAVAKVTWGYNDLGVIKRDIEKAKSLLAEAGYPDGFDTKIVTTPRYTKGVELAEVISQQLLDIGINAEVEVLEWSAILPTWCGYSPEEFDEPMFIMGCGPSMMDADGGLRGLYTTTETGTNERNYSFYSNAEVDELIDKGMHETDPIKRNEYYKRAEEILVYEDPAAIWLYDSYRTAGYNAELDNVITNGIGLPMFHLMEYK